MPLDLASLKNTINAKVKPGINAELAFMRGATRDAVEYVKGGAVEAHRDVADGRRRERKEDGYGHARENVVYGWVRRAEEELGMGGKTQAPASDPGPSTTSYGTASSAVNGVPDSLNTGNNGQPPAYSQSSPPGRTAGYPDCSLTPAPALPPRPEGAYIDTKHPNPSNPPILPTPDAQRDAGQPVAAPASDSDADSVVMLPLGPGEYHVVLVPEQPPEEQGPMFGPAPETHLEKAKRVAIKVDDVTDEIAVEVMLALVLGPWGLVKDIIEFATEKDLKEARKDEEKTKAKVKYYTAREAELKARAAELETQLSYAALPGIVPISETDPVPAVGPAFHPPPPTDGEDEHGKEQTMFVPVDFFAETPGAAEPGKVREMYDKTAVRKEDRKAYDKLDETARELKGTRDKLVKARDRDRKAESVLHAFEYKDAKKQAKKRAKKERKEAGKKGWY